jgi:predicted phosphodiesterase
VKIGIFSDVHGHIEALNRTLKLLDSLQADHIICAGDLVEKGLEGDAVIEVMRERAIPCMKVEAKVIILGNTHHPMHIRFNDKHIINPGSIYGNRDRGERTCGLLKLPECIFDVYDIETGRKLAL